MLANPTTIEQQLEFMTELREAFDRDERERVALIRPPEETAQLFKDIHENLVSVRNWHRANQAEAKEALADVCGDCNCGITSQNLADNERYDVVLDKREIVCVACADKRIDRLEQSSMGLP